MDSSTLAAESPCAHPSGTIGASAPLIPLFSTRLVFRYCMIWVSDVTMHVASVANVVTAVFGSHAFLVGAG